MTENENSVVDPSVLFGGMPSAPAVAAAAPDDGIPDFLRRADDGAAAGGGNVADVAGNAGDTADSGVVDGGTEETVAPETGGPAFTTAVDDTGQTTLTVEPAHSQPEHAPPVEGDLAHDNSTNSPPPDPATREEMLKDFNRDIAAYGKDSGKGAAALPRLGLRVIRAAADGLISNEKPKDGTKSDAVRIYEKYAEQDSKHAEHSKGGMKANAAKLNALIGLGCMTTVDGVEVADRAVALREKMEGEDLKPKALFAGLVDVARAQMEEDQPLTDDAIMGALGKTVKDKTLEDEWNSIYKKVEKLVTGENPAGIKDDSDRAMKIAEQINEHIKNFAQDTVDEDRIAFCMEKGMTREQATAFVKSN